MLPGRGAGRIAASLAQPAVSSVKRILTVLSDRVRRYDRGLTPRHIRTQAVVLAAGLWITAAYTLATRGAFDRNGILKGIDFLQFYTAARIVFREGAGRLYDWVAFADELRSVVPGTGDLLFLSVYPPQLALLLSPLGALTYFPAVAVWTVISALLYAASIRLIASQFPAIWRVEAPWWLLALAFVPFQQLILHGQVGALPLVCLTFAWLALRRDRWWLAGMALGSLCFKPPFLIAALASVAASRNLRLAAGVVVGAGIQVAAVAILVGPGVWADYLDKVAVLLRSPEMFEPKPWQMHNIKGFWRLLLGDRDIVFALWLASVPPVLLAVDHIWRRTASADLRIAAVVVATVLLNPHLYIYDLVILAVPFAAIVRWLIDAPDTRSAPAIRVCLHLLWWAPLVGPLAILTRVQLTPILLAALLGTLLQAVRETGVRARPIAGRDIAAPTHPPAAASR
jgi:hypothetical protein